MTRFRVRHPPALAAVGFALAMTVLAGCAYLVREGTIAYMKVGSLFSDRDIEIEINRSFIEKYKDRVAIATSFTVDKAMQNPQSHLLDGDLHMAGRAPEIGLPVVAEIANAASARNAVDLVHRIEGTGRPVKISGVWRIWAEHAGRTDEVQGAPVPVEASDNPGHVFEIHPVTRIGEIGLLDTFRPIEGFLPGDASRTFGIYQNVPCTIAVKDTTVSIVTRKGIYNNVEFVMEVLEDRQIEASGGRFVMAAARDLNGALLVARLRMVFADNTPAEKAVRRLKRGGRLRVYALPRIDLAEISRRVRSAPGDPAVLSKPLPYEMIIQGFYRDPK